jgi:hypothetical protein
MLDFGEPSHARDQRGTGMHGLSVAVQMAELKKATMSDGRAYLESLWRRGQPACRSSLRPRGSISLRHAVSKQAKGAATR